MARTFSQYESLRLANIKRNEAKLQALGLLAEDNKRTQEQTTTRKRKRVKRSSTPAVPSRRSRRVSKLPVPNYLPPASFEENTREHKQEIEEQIRKGYRLKNGKWQGQRFGKVKGVPVGTVFGKGDYQRLGRRAMADNGFFRPFVTPEWFEPKGACYGIILNNDNGLSSDHGDTIEYAGSGGRMRGQNRTAPQSFHQSFENATNAALRRNFLEKKPVRVIRGPKLNSKYGTRRSGGGYRYDGLYRVVRAELVLKPASKGSKKNKQLLRTAMFTLERCTTTSKKG